MAGKRRPTLRPHSATPPKPAPEVAATHRALALWGQGEYDAALPFFREAARRAPNSLDARVNLARAYVLVRDYGRVDACLDKLLRDRPHDPAAQHAAGETYRSI